MEAEYIVSFKSDWLRSFEGSDTSENTEASLAEKTEINDSPRRSPELLRSKGSIVWLESGGFLLNPELQVKHWESKSEMESKATKSTGDFKTDQELDLGMKEMDLWENLKEKCFKAGRLLVSQKASVGQLENNFDQFLTWSRTLRLERDEARRQFKKYEKNLEILELQNANLQNIVSQLKEKLKALQSEIGFEKQGMKSSDVFHQIDENADENNAPSSRKKTTRMRFSFSWGRKLSKKNLKQIEKNNYKGQVSDAANVWHNQETAFSPAAKHNNPPICINKASSSPRWIELSKKDGNKSFSWSVTPEKRSLIRSETERAKQNLEIISAKAKSFSSRPRWSSMIEEVSGYNLRNSEFQIDLDQVMCTQMM